MRNKLYWGIASLILIIGVVGVYFISQPDPESEKVFIEPSEADLKKAREARKLPPGASPNRHSDGDESQEQVNADDTPAVLSTNETVADTTETDAVSEDALDPSKMSPFGLGPYPEIPKEWNPIPDYWDRIDSLELELITRVDIKMYNEGIRSKYGSIGMDPATRLITAIERGSVLVEYEIDENGEKRIYRTLAHPDDLSPGMYMRVSEFPSHLKIVTVDDIGFDPYEYLGISK